jgi:hypothetical protein
LINAAESSSLIGLKMLPIGAAPKPITVVSSPERGHLRFATGSIFLSSFRE